MSDERWKPVAGWRYEVSDRGNVRRLLKGRSRAVRPVLSRYGYYRVTLSSPEKQFGAHIHCLVAEAFLGPRPTPLHEAAHRDGCRTNNVLSNLRWATPQENAEDREHHGRTARGSRIASAKLNEELARRIYASEGARQDIARMHGVSPYVVYEIKCRGAWRHVTGSAARRKW